MKAIVAAVCVATLVSCAPAARAPVVRIRAVAFEPAAVTVRAGDDVTWVNDDGFAHTITAPHHIDERIEPGATVVQAFDVPGTYAYACRIHPANMRGEVRVTEEGT